MPEAYSARVEWLSTIFNALRSNPRTDHFLTLSRTSAEAPAKV